MNTIISAIDALLYRDDYTTHDAMQVGGLQIVLHSDRAVDIANKVLISWYDCDTLDDIQYLGYAQPLRVGDSIAYDSDHTAYRDDVIYLDTDISDKIRSALYDELGTPNIETRPIESLGYERASNSDWGVWCWEVVIDDDNNITEWLS